MRVCMRFVTALRCVAAELGRAQQLQRHMPQLPQRGQRASATCVYREQSLGARPIPLFAAAKGGLVELQDATDKHNTHFELGCGRLHAHVRYAKFTRLKHGGGRYVVSELRPD